MSVIASIIIPNFNGKHHLDACLSSLAQQTRADFEVLVVDNGSADGSLSFMREEYPDVRVLEMGTNLGFTRACNAGLAASRGDFIILLNNDTAVEPDWLDVIVRTFEGDPLIGIVASKMLLFDDRKRIHTTGDFYRISGIPGNRGVWQQDTGQYDAHTTVFGACGGAAAYRRSMIDAIGFLDDDYYFSCEDVDMSWRAQLAGWTVVYAPDAIVYHKLKATGGNTLSSFYDGRNFLYVIAKNYPASLLKRHWRAILGAQLGITRDALRAWRGAEARARLRGQAAGLLGLFRMLRKRKQVMATRRVSDDYLMTVLTAVDE